MQESDFKLGKYWIDRVNGSSNWYRFWYDSGSGEIRRRSLKTEDLEAAKIELAAIVLTEGSGKTEDPDNVALITVLTKYYEEHGDQRRSGKVARTAGMHLLNFLGNTAKVGELTKVRQREFFRSMAQAGYKARSIGSYMIMIQAAVNYATKEGDDGSSPVLSRAPKIICSGNKIAEITGLPAPAPRNWSPSLDIIANLINGLKDSEDWLRRFIIIKLAFACRNEAAQDLGPGMLDHGNQLANLNPPGRIQTKKYRPTLPVPEPLWPVLTSDAWSDAATFVHVDGMPVRPVHDTWRRVRERNKLPRQLIPHSLRHFIATELRHAHLRYGVPRVPADEREMWLGHRRPGIHDDYGIFEPDFLEAAKKAVGAILLALDAKLARPFFRQTTAKPPRKSRQRKPSNPAAQKGKS